MNELDAVVRHAEDVVRDLGQRRFQALAMTVRADPQFEPAIRREARAALLIARYERNSPAGVDAGAVAGLLRIHRDADAEQPPVRFAAPLALANGVETDRLDRPPQCFGVVAR